MRLHRFIRKVDIYAPILRIDDAELLNQLRNVFRLKPGDNIILCDGAGKEAEAEIKSFNKNEVELSASEVRPVPLPRNKVELNLAVIKKDNFELVVQKATECGATKIVPLITERTVKLNVNMERGRKIALEAAEQSGRGTVPEIAKPIEFKKAVEQSSGFNIFCDADGEPIKGMLDEGKDIAVWIGPEGGWTDEERTAAKNKRFIIASLGENTLRAETAAIVATYLAATA